MGIYPYSKVPCVLTLGNTVASISLRRLLILLTQRTSYPTASLKKNGDIRLSAVEVDMTDEAVEIEMTDEAVEATVKEDTKFLRDEKERRRWYPSFP